jgi:hypothetical protein
MLDKERLTSDDTRCRALAGVLSPAMSITGDHWHRPVDRPDGQFKH